MQAVLVAGNYLAVSTAGKATAEAPFTVKPAERTELTIKAAVGVIAVATAGANSIKVFHAAAGLDGKRDRLHIDHGKAGEVMVPPGAYLIVATKAESSVTVIANQRSNPTLILVMGEARISATQARVIEIHAAEIGPSGKPERLHTDYGESTSFMLPPGSYTVVARYDDDSCVEAPLTIINFATAEVNLTQP